MAEERIPVTIVFDSKTGEIHRIRGKGTDIIEDKVIAKYNPETQVASFANVNTLRLYKPAVITFLAENELTVRSFQREDIEADKPLTKQIPPRPKKNKHEGDKTKEVVAWYHKHRWNEFCTRYGYLGQYTGEVIVETPVWEPRPIDGLMEYRGAQKIGKTVEDVMVTLRKTHLSYTPEECTDWSEEEPEFGDEPAAAPSRGGKGKEDDDS